MNNIKIIVITLKGLENYLNGGVFNYFINVSQSI